MTYFVQWSQSVGLTCKTVKCKVEGIKNIFSIFPAIVNFSLCCRMDGLHRLHSKVLTDKLLTQVSPRSQCRLWLCPHDRYRSVVTPAPSSASVAAVRSSIKIGSQYLLVARTSPMEDTRKTGGWRWSVPVHHTGTAQTELTTDIWCLNISCMNRSSHSSTVMLSTKHNVIKTNSL